MDPEHRKIVYKAIADGHDVEVIHIKGRPGPGGPGSYHTIAAYAQATGVDSEVLRQRLIRLREIKPDSFQEVTNPHSRKARHIYLYEDVMPIIEEILQNRQIDPKQKKTTDTKHSSRS